MTTPPPSRARAYQCAICNEQYNRPDHLIRHVRTHTKQRPFVCSVCTKAFSRRDLLKRHAQAHRKAGHDGTGPSLGISGDYARYGPRVQQACRSCAAKKLKCTDSKPCQRCTEKGIFCEYAQSPEIQPEPLPMDMEGVPHDAASPIAGSISSQCPQEHEGAWSHTGGGGDRPPQTITGAHHDEPHHTAETADPCMSLLDFNTHTLDQTHSSLIDATQDVLGLTFDLPSFGEFIEQEADPDFEHVNLQFLSEFIMTPAAPSVNLNSSSSTTAHSPVLGFAEEIYQKSHVHKGWDPGPEDDSPRTESLELPSNVRSEVLATSRNRSLRLNKGDVTLATRDKLLAMIYTKTPKVHWRRMSSTFESIDVLKSITHHALLHLQDHQMVPFLHLPSFDLNEQRPELFGALLAYGAVCLPSEAMRKFGYALQELVRLAIYQKAEEEPASLQELGFTQAYYIQLYLGFWSAMSAKIEVAESSSMLGATILRRRKMLRAESYVPPEAFLSKSLSLHEKWARWIEQESRIRLVYFAMVVDAEVSLARNLNPLFAYSEIATPLPAATRLWEAPTAEQWYEILAHDSSLRLRQARPIRRLLREPQLIRAEKDIVDTTAAAAAMLAGYWALVYEYRQIDALHRTVQDWNNFVLNSRRQEIVSFLDQLRMELTELEGLPIQVVLLQELIQLHLHAAYYEITVCFGRGTTEEAQAAKPYVEWWCESQQARHAILHAGQIFRFIKDLKPEALLDLPVVALYHAMEILWVWGLMQQAQNNRAEVSKLPPVSLDGDESPAVARFLRISRGQAGVTGPSNGFLPLIEPVLVSDLANNIIKANWGTHLQPWTTSEVSRLVQGFSRIYRERLDSLKEV